MEFTSSSFIYIFCILPDRWSLESLVPPDYDLMSCSFSPLAFPSLLSLSLTHFFLSCFSLSPSLSISLIVFYFLLGLDKEWKEGSTQHQEKMANSRRGEAQEDWTFQGRDLWHCPRAIYPWPLWGHIAFLLKISNLIKSTRCVLGCQPCPRQCGAVRTIWNQGEFQK